jgi:hypothetical protein
MIRSLILTTMCVVMGASTVAAEERTYGAIDLNGLSRASWGYNPAGVYNTMVCNVNGSDGYLAIRNGPGSSYHANRKLNRLAIVEVDTRNRNGHWVEVRTAYRTHSKSGRRLSQEKNLHVSGWAHDGYLCDFLD